MKTILILSMLFFASLFLVGQESDDFKITKINDLPNNESDCKLIIVAQHKGNNTYENIIYLCDNQNEKLLDIFKIESREKCEVTYFNRKHLLIIKGNNVYLFNIFNQSITRIISNIEGINNRNDDYIMFKRQGMLFQYNIEEREEYVISIDNTCNNLIHKDKNSLMYYIKGKKDIKVYSYNVKEGISKKLYNAIKKYKMFMKNNNKIIRSISYELFKSGELYMFIRYMDDIYDLYYYDKEGMRWTLVIPNLYPFPGRTDASPPCIAYVGTQKILLTSNMLDNVSGQIFIEGDNRYFRNYWDSQKKPLVSYTATYLYDVSKHIVLGCEVGIAYEYIFRHNVNNLWYKYKGVDKQSMMNVNNPLPILYDNKVVYKDKEYLLGKNIIIPEGYKYLYEKADDSGNCFAFMFESNNKNYKIFIYDVKAKKLTEYNLPCEKHIGFRVNFELM